MQLELLLYLILVFSITFVATPDTRAFALSGSTRSWMNSLGTNSTVQPISAAAQEKAGRTPAQKKSDSQLLYALYRKRGEAEAKGVPSGELLVKFDDKGRAIVSIRARVNKTVLAKIKRSGGKIISTSQRSNDIRAHIPLEKLETLAELKDVFAIMPAEEAITNDPPR
jgi:hypothetical protein